MKKLTKGIEESGKEKDRLTNETERLKGVFKEIELKAIAVQENYKKTQEVLFLVWLCKSFSYIIQLTKMDSRIYLFILPKQKAFIAVYRKQRWLNDHVLFTLLPCR